MNNITHKICKKFLTKEQRNNLTDLYKKDSFNNNTFQYLLEFCRKFKNIEAVKKEIELSFKEIYTHYSNDAKNLDRQGHKIAAENLRKNYSEICLSLLPILFCTYDITILQDENSEALLEQEIFMQIPLEILQYFNLPDPEETQLSPAPLIQNPLLPSSHAQQIKSNNEATNTSSSNATSETVSSEKSDTDLPYKPSKIKQKKPNSLLQLQTEPLLANLSKKPQEEAPNPELRIQKDEDVYRWVARIKEEYGVNVTITQGGNHIHVYNNRKLVTVASRSNNNDRIGPVIRGKMNRQIEANLKLPTKADSKSDTQ